MIDLIDRQIEAYNRRDLEAFVRCYHPHIQVTHLNSEHKPLHGIEELRTLYGTVFETNPKIHGEIKSRIILESSIIDEEWITGSVKYPNGLHGVVIYAFRDGLIDRVWFPH